MTPHHGHAADGLSGVPPASGCSSKPNTHHSVVLRIQAFVELTERTRALLTHLVTSEGMGSLFNDLF